MPKTFPAILTSVALATLAWASAVTADPLAPTGKWSAFTDGRAATPPMGWSSWNAFQMNVDEAKVLASAKVIVDSGLGAKGYRYINIDDGWWLKRRESDGRMIIRTKTFPSAATGGRNETSFKPFTDRIHAMGKEFGGLKAGIYSDLGRNSCSQAYGGPKEVNLPEGSVAEREVGLYGHTDQDIKLYFKEWGFDFIKVDACGVRAFAPGSERVVKGDYRAFDPLIDQKYINRTNVEEVRRLYTDIATALKRENPDGDYVFSLCVWGSADVRAWGKEVGNMSRTSDDISPKWTSLLTNFDSVSTRALYAHPGSWNDPDMLYIGAGDFDENHLTEARSHFALWAIVNAPLMIGYDLLKAPPALMEIFGNTDIIAVNQDPAGNQAVMVYDSSDVQIFVKTLSDPSQKAVAIFNRGVVPLNVILSTNHFKFAPGSTVALTDLWTKAASTFKGETKLHIEPHQTLIFSAKGERALPNGLYLSESPSIVNPAVDGVRVRTSDPMIYRQTLPWGSGPRGGGERAMYSGWGGAQADSTPYGQILNLAGKTFMTGIGVLSNSRLEVRNAGFSQFTAQVGVDDSSPDKGQSVTFYVYGDGKLLATSKAKTYGEAPEALSVDVTKTKIIELVARDDAAPNAMPAIVTWGDAALTR